MRAEVDSSDPVNWGSSLNASLMSWWKALPDQQRGNVFRDLANRNHGNLTNGPTWSGLSHPGGWGSLALDGTDDFVGVSTTPFVAAITDKFTISFWVMPTITGGGVDRRYFNLGGTAASIAARYGFGSVGTLTVVIAGVGITDFTSGMSINNWWHVCVCYDGAAYGVFVNGVSKGSTADTGNVDWGFSSSPSTIGSAAAGATAMAGFMDDFRIHNAVISPALLYQESLSGDPTTLNWQRRLTYFDTGAAPPAGNRRRRVLIGTCA